MRDGHNQGIVARDDALRMAHEQSLDLVQMTQDAEPVVCRIMDYGKHQFTKRKQSAVARRNQHRMQIKEVKFRVATEAADYSVKLGRLRQFLGHGDKVKITLRYRGREMIHQELGLQMLERVRDDLSEIGFVELDPELERRQLSMVIAPYRKGQQGSRVNKSAVGNGEASGQTVAGTGGGETAVGNGEASGQTVAGNGGGKSAVGNGEASGQTVAGTGGGEIGESATARPAGKTVAGNGGGETASAS